MITEEKKQVYLKDKVVNILLTDKDTRCYAEAIIAYAIDIPLEIVKDNLELITPRINDNVNTEYSMVDANYENDTSIINIEVNYRNTIKGRNRSMKYVCHLILKQIRKYNKGLNIKPIYQININNYDIYKKDKFIYKSYMMEETLHIKRDNMISIIDINMDFLKKKNYTEIKKGNSLEKLLYILICEDKNELNKLYIGDGVMEKVREKLESLTDDFDNDLYYNLEEFQKEENYELGMKTKSIEIAKNLLRKNLSDKDIIEVTNITIEELKEIKNRK